MPAITAVDLAGAVIDSNRALDMLLAILIVRFKSINDTLQNCLICEKLFVSPGAVCEASKRESAVGKDCSRPLQAATFGTF